MNAAASASRASAAGDGPVDAVFKAIEQVTGIAVKLRDFQVASVTTGKDAQGEVTLECEHTSRRLPRPRRSPPTSSRAAPGPSWTSINRIALKAAPTAVEALAAMGAP